MSAQYRNWWPLLDEMPPGWSIDRRAGSPLAGYEFITDGRAPIHGGKRALLRIRPRKQFPFDAPSQQLPPHDVTPAAQKARAIQLPASLTQDERKTVNDLARAKFKQRILGDVLADMVVCELEGWNKMDYIRELTEMIAGIGKSRRNGGAA